MGLFNTYSQSESPLRLVNKSELQISYQFTDIAHQIPLEYIHSFGRHGILVGLRHLIIRGGYRFVDDPATSLGYTLGYQYRFNKDVTQRLQPYLSYRFFYNPNLTVSTLSYSSTYTPQQQVVVAGLKYVAKSNLYSFITVGGTFTHYIVTIGSSPKPEDKGKLNYTFQFGAGYAFKRGKNK